ncbi:prephenate dehydratase [Candidatus Methanosphaera massiliense]|jgi:prephenate dehydratase|uniref:prephenate dehydratase n=1 Tax=Methanosphaera TaxID=2316 RepID=UPI00237FE4BD|nr:prephenate dehydratase [Candidatus Methanosphaera massiliense]MDE4077816.1 prephenate dehydratase [Candidatus Methanosphaera massiliense]MDY2744223.1 prephenate dehydratase [Methanosphaera sp.]
MNEKKQVGYLGPEGTFSQEAVLNITDNNTINKPYPNILSIFEALEDNQIDEAVVPIENSTEGSVVITLDALTRHNLKIKGELELPIRQNLLVQKGKTLDDINVICSHQQAIAQCRHYINRLNKPVHAMPSTANAARYVTELSTAAVIGNEILSEKYNLEIIAHDIQDYSNNVTRFVILDKEDINKPTGNDKTSIIISLKNDNPGSLYEILYEFAKENINLTKIESRPSKQGMGKYLFFIDIVGHRLDPKIKNTLAIVEGKVNMFKILGSYSYDFGGGD